MEIHEFESITEEEAEATWFELHEEENIDEWENEETTRPHQWKYVVNEVCNEVPIGDDISDGVRYESDLDNLCSDDEEQAMKKTMKK